MKASISLLQTASYPTKRCSNVRAGRKSSTHQNHRRRHRPDANQQIHGRSSHYQQKPPSSDRKTLPLIVGHEFGGVVKAVGKEVTRQVNFSLFIETIPLADIIELGYLRAEVDRNSFVRLVVKC